MLGLGLFAFMLYTRNIFRKKSFNFCSFTMTTMDFYRGVMSVRLQQDDSYVLKFDCYTFNCKVFNYIFKVSLREASSFTELHCCFTDVFHAGKTSVI